MYGGLQTSVPKSLAICSPGHQDGQHHLLSPSPPTSPAPRHIPPLPAAPLFPFLGKRYGLMFQTQDLRVLGGSGAGPRNFRGNCSQKAQAACTERQVEGWVIPHDGPCTRVRTSVRALPLLFSERREVPCSSGSCSERCPLQRDKKVTEERTGVSPEGPALNCGVGGWS